jgi:ABC-type amino acid transport substrate-binding protein
LRVGVTDNGDWLDASGAEPQGVEPALVRQFASRIGAKVLWTRGSETALAQSLKHGELDAIGGFDQKTPWKSIAGVSRPFTQTEDKKKHVFLAPPGENDFILTLDTFLAEHMRGSKGASV